MLHTVGCTNFKVGVHVDSQQNQVDYPRGLGFNLVGFHLIVPN